MIISEDNMKSALIRSGYLLEQRIAQKLSHKGFYVETNVPYPDPVSNKTREYDLQATLSKQIKLGGDYSIRVSLFLVIEAINNSQPVLFFAKNNVEGRLPDHSQEFVFSGWPMNWFYEGQEVPIGSRISCINSFHQFSISASTQYCTFKLKDKSQSKKSESEQEWMAWHPDEYASDLRKLVDESHFLSTEINRKAFEKRHEQAHLALFYPVHVIQNEVRKAFSEPDLRLDAVEHVVFEQGIISDAEARFVSIDIVTESGLEAYLALVENEYEQVIEFIMENENECIEATKHFLKSPSINN